MYKMLFSISLTLFLGSALTSIIVGLWLMASGEEVPLPFKKGHSPPKSFALRVIRVAQVTGAIAFLATGVFVVLWFRNA
jgi:hypothetical protein